jgi:hypothetical protein
LITESTSPTGGAPQTKQLLSLSKEHPYFKNRRVKYTPCYHGVDLSSVDWGQQESLKTVFPPLKGLGKAQVPLGLLIDCEEEADKFLVVQWWRSSSKDEQIRAREDIKRFYRAFSNSNDKIDSSLKKTLKRALSLSNNPTAKKFAAAMKPEEIPYAGALDEPEIRKIAAKTTSSSASILERSKKRQPRLADERAKVPEHLMDKKTRKEMEKAEKAVGKANKATAKSDDASFPGVHSVGLASFRTVSTPEANGKILKDRPLRSKALFSFSIPPGMPTTFVERLKEVSAEQDFETNVYTPSKKGPMTAYNDRNRKQKYMSLEEQRRIQDEDVARGKIGRTIVYPDKM